MKKELNLKDCVLPAVCLVPGDEVAIMVSVIRDGVHFVYKTPDLNNHNFTCLNISASCF